MTPGGKITPHLSFRNTCEEFVCDKMDKKKRFLHRLYTRFFLLTPQMFTVTHLVL